MPLFNSRIRGRGIGFAAVVEFLILLALGLAFVRYVEWSSHAAVPEFIATQSVFSGGIRHADADRFGPRMGRSSLRLEGSPLVGYWWSVDLGLSPHSGPLPNEHLRQAGRVVPSSSR